MYIRSCYDKMIQSLQVFASAVRLAESNIQSSCSVMSRTMEDDDEGKKVREDINKLCITFGDLAADAESVAKSLEEEKIRIEKEAQDGQ